MTCQRVVRNTLASKTAGKSDAQDNAHRLPQKNPSLLATPASSVTIADVFKTRATVFKAD